MDSDYDFSPACSQSQGTTVQKLDRYSMVYAWFKNEMNENFPTEEEKEMYLMELDKHIVSVNLLAYPFFPQKILKHVPAALLLNKLLEKRMSVNSTKIKSADGKEDSGVFMEEDATSVLSFNEEEEHILTVEECIAYYQQKEVIENRTLASLMELFGFSNLKPQQQEVMNAVVAGRDCFAVMPTGGGKSACYFLPGLLQNGVTIVISPLNALIFDQINYLKSHGVKAICDELEFDSVLLDSFSSNTRRDGFSFVFCTPEKLCLALNDHGTSNKLKNLMTVIQQNGVLLRFVVDECHCVVTWGLDFRKDYGRLSIIRTTFPDVPITALTGTASLEMQRDIIASLCLRNPFMSRFPCVRANLKHSLISKSSFENGMKIAKDLILKDFLNQCGIVYCITRANCQAIAEFLVSFGLAASYYHSGLDEASRNDIQEKWMNGEVQIICATLAFGMGINKPDVRFVIHLSMPKSIDSYYQECGRAGRDGQLAFCTMIYKFSDYFEQQSLINYDPLRNKVKEIQTVELGNLKKMAIFCENRRVCRNVGIANFLDEIPRSCDVFSPAICDICELKDRYFEVDVIKHVREIRATIILNSTTQFTTSSIVDIFRGDKKRKLKNGDVRQCAMYGKGADWNIEDAYSFVQKLILDGVLEDTLVCVDNRKPYANIRVGNNWPLSKYEFAMMQSESSASTTVQSKRFKADLGAE